MKPSRFPVMEEMTVKQVREYLQRKRSIIIPIGVTEQHGYHLPLRTDCYNCEEISRRAADHTGVFVAPTLAYTYSGGELPGTINVSPHVVTQIVVEILQSLCLQGLRNIILVLGHGGSENDRATQEGAELFLRQHPQYADRNVAVFRFSEDSELCKQAFADGDFHSGYFETSLMMYWAPDEVRPGEPPLDKPEVVKMMREDQDAYQVFTSNVDYPGVVKRVSQNPAIEVGVMGEPSKASAELGKRICEEAVAGLVALIRAVEGA